MRGWKWLLLAAAIVFLIMPTTAVLASPKPSPTILAGTANAGKIHWVMVIGNPGDLPGLRLLKGSGGVWFGEADDSTIETLRTQGYGVLVVDYMKEINFLVATFDPLESLPNYNPMFKAPDGATNYRIVQFEGPVTEEEFRALEGTGARILSYVPYNAYVVWADDSVIQRITALEGVRWVGNYDYYFRIHPEVMDSLRDSIYTMVAPGVRARTMGAQGLFAGEPDSRLVTIVYDPKAVNGRTIAAMMSSEVLDMKFIGDLRLARGLLNVKDILKVAKTEGVLWIEPYKVPELFDELYMELDEGPYPEHEIGQPPNELGSWTDVIAGYTGQGVTVALGDTGIYWQHPDFQDRVIAIHSWAGDDGHDGYGHGTATAHVAAGYPGVPEGYQTDENGYYWGLGQSPDALIAMDKIFSDAGYWLFPDYYEMARWAWSIGARVHSNSWGANTGGAYTTEDAVFDWLVRDSNDATPDVAEPIQFVFAAGNAGPGSNTVGSPGNAKNVITVGGTEIDRFGYSHENIIWFASRGPTDDGRIKPDIVLPAGYVAVAHVPGTSTGWGLINDYYKFWGGTSFACPGGAGLSATFIQFYRELFGVEPTPAMIKSAIIASAYDLTGTDAEDPIPNFNEGWGFPYLPNIIEPEGYNVHFLDVSNGMTAPLETGETWTYTVDVLSSTVPLKIIMSYVDYPGNPSAAKALVNDLDLVVVSPSGDMYFGNDFDSSGNSIPNTGTPDNTNNVEGVYIPNPEVGTWTIMVVATDVAQDSVIETPEIDQDFAVTVLGDIPSQGAMTQIRTNKKLYHADDWVTVTVLDKEANLSPNKIDKVTVKIVAEGTGDVLIMHLLETGPDKGKFVGTFRMLPGYAQDDGTLQVNLLDSFNVTYVNRSGVLYWTIAFVDSVPPVIENVEVVETAPTTATISVTTDEPTTVRVVYGFYPDKLDYIKTVNSLDTTHTIVLEGLLPAMKYYFTLSVTDQNGNTASWGEIGYLITDVPPSVLVVDDTGNDPNFGYVLDALDAAGIDYIVYQVSAGDDGPPLAFLAKFPMVIWSTGYQWAATLTSNDQINLAAYLDSGGNLLLFGQDVIWDIGVNWFVQNYLHVQHASEDQFYLSISGVSGEPLTEDMYYIYLDYYGAGYYPYDDYLYPDSVATPIFQDYWYGDPTAIKAYTDTYKVIFAGFMAEVWGYSDPDTLTTFFERVYDDFIGAVGANIAISNVVFDEPWYPLGSDMRINMGVYTQESDFSDVYLRLDLTHVYCTPRVRILSPGPGELVYGTVTIVADAEGATMVEAYAAGTYLGVDHDPPYVFLWDTSGLPTGDYEILVRAVDAEGHVATDTVSVHVFGVIGPDGFGYTASLTTFNWIDAESEGTLILQGVDDDYEIYDLPFSFPFYDETLTSVRVNSNGGLASRYLSFWNSPLPDDAYKWLIVPYWDDLVVDYESPYGIYALETTYDGMDAVVFQYNVRHLGTSGMWQFEIILLENGDIIFQYLDVSDCSAYNNGESATVGIQGNYGEDGWFLQFSYNEPVLQDGMALRFYRPLKAGVNDEAPTQRTVGGPDGFGYYYDDSVSFNWVDFTSGTLVIGGYADDDTATIDLPFNFPFYGMLLNQLSVSTNGFLMPSDDSSADYSNEELPTDDHDFIIAPFWDDLAVDDDYVSESGIYTLQTTFDGQDAFVIGWLVTAWGYYEEEAYYSFEVILLRDGTIYFQYQDVSGDGYHDNGGSATVGIQGSMDPALNYYLQYSYDEEVIYEGMAIKFYRITTNQPPEAPVVNAPDEVYPFTEFSITVSSVDPDGDDVMYVVDWGDGNVETTDYYPSGQSVTLTHSYSQKGTFEVCVTAFDRFGAESDSTCVEIHVIWYNIAEARGLPDGTDVFVIGQVTVRPNVFSDKIFWIQDGTAGIKVYTDGFPVASLPLGEYTLVGIKGYVDTYKGDREIVVNDPENIMILGTQRSMVEPYEVVVDWAKEINGDLVTFVGTITKKASSYLIVADDTGSVKVWIDSDTGIDLGAYEVGDLVRITGVQAYYYSTPEIMPRWQGDIEKLGSTSTLYYIGDIEADVVLPIELAVPIPEGDWKVSITLLTPPHTDPNPMDNKFWTLKRSFVPEEPIKVAIVDSWAADNYDFTAFPQLADKWYMFGNSPLIIDYTSLNTDPLTWEGFLEADADVLFISDAWTYVYGWEFDWPEANAIKAWLIAGHSGIATSGTFSITPGYTEGYNLMFLADAWGLNASIPAYWADYVFHYEVVPDFADHYIFNYGHFCRVLGTDWDNGVFFAAVGNVPEGANMLAYTVGYYTGLVGPLTEYYYHGGTTIFIPTMPELAAPGYGHNEMDDILLYNTISYAAQNRAPYSGVDLSVVKMDMSNNFVDVGETIYINASVVNSGLSTATNVPVYLMLLDLESETASIVDYQIVPTLGYLGKADVSFEYTPSSEGIFGLIVYAYVDDPTPDTNYIGYVIFVVHPEGTIRVVGVDSFSTDNPDYTVLPFLQQYWFMFGKYKIEYDDSSLDKDDITYEDLVEAHPDVLFISDAWYEGYGWEFTDSEIDAIMTFVNEGHSGIIATGGSACWHNGYHGNFNNYKFGPMFGLDTSSMYWATLSDYFYFSTPDTVDHELLTSPGEVGYYDDFYGVRVWMTGGYYASYDWALNGATLVGGDYDTVFGGENVGMVTVYEYGHGAAIYFSYIPDLAPAVVGATIDDYQIVYNAIVYAYKYTDDVAPSIAVTEPEDGAVFDTPTVHVAWTAYDAKPGIAYFEVYANDELVYTGTDYEVDLELADGEYTITVVAYDGAGNSASDSVSIIVDLDEPVVAITSPAPGEIVAENPVLITWNGIDNHIDHFEVSVDGGAFINVGTATAYSVYLADGDHYATVRLYDMAGRVAEDTVYFTVDTTPPDLSVTTPYEGQEIHDSLVPVHVVAHDSGTGIEDYTITLYVWDPDTETWVQVDSYTGTDEWHLFIVTPELVNAHSNTFKIVATASDFAGHTTTVEVIFYVYP